MKKAIQEAEEQGKQANDAIITRQLELEEFKAKYERKEKWQGAADKPEPTTPCYFSTG